MADELRARFSKGIEKLFGSGTVILFKCAATSDFPILSVSQNAKEILGFAPSYFQENPHGWSSQIHPDEKEAVVRRFEKVIADGAGAINEYRFKTKEGSYIWLRDEIQVVKDDDGDRVIYGSSINITERKEAEIKLRENKTEELKQEIDLRKSAEKKLQKRLQYEKVISKCSKLLLESNSSEALRKSLHLLQEVSGVDRIFLYKNKVLEDELYLDPIMEVTKPGVDPVVDNIDQHLNYADFPWLHEQLSSLRTVHAKIDELPDPERTMLADQQVKSILIIPFTIEDEWKGYIGFADTHEKREWEEEEISLLSTVSRIIAAFEKRRSIEQTLVEQRNYTETVLDSLPSIYLLMNEDFEFVQWNSFAERNTGYSSEELAQMTAYDIIAPEDHELLEEATERIRNKKGVGTELEMLTRSGERIPYFWKGYYTEFRGTEYFLSVGIDITQQKETQKALEQEKRFTEGLIESLPGIFYTVDKEGNYIRWNENFEENLGYTSEEIASMNPSDFYPEKEYARIEKGIKEAFEKGHNMLETKISTKEGKEVPYLLTANIIEQNGEPYLTGVGHDISEQVKARQKLRRSEKLFRNLFLNAPAGIVMVGPDNAVLDINKSFEHSFGYSLEEIKGQDIDEFIVPEEERGEVPRMPLKKYASQSFYREAKRVTKSGDLVDVFIAAIPVYIDGEPIAGFGMYIDITEEKKYEQQMSKSLKEKQVMLKEIHHRVKNNLAVVSGLLQLQMYESDDPLIHDTLRESERRIQAMALIHEKLYNSPKMDHISCDTYIGELVETIRSTIDSDQEVKVFSNIDGIELSIERAVPFALLINEVVTNSFKHAFDGKENNKIVIDIAEKEGQVHAQIRDNGIGLPENFNPENSDSLGMSLIDNFIRQLDAEWQMGTDDGTYITLQFTADDEDEMLGMQ
ncbi:MAG: PAS domain S-box protein [Bacteroidota bacterium]